LTPTTFIIVIKYLSIFVSSLADAQSFKTTKYVVENIIIQFDIIANPTKSFKLLAVLRRNV